ncbi:MAG: nicotinate-nucleotide adenylyltransferase [Bacteroidales bacterium]|nr:nicotinate-nucleotide adenylyltransferase [Bacteroidales bacterium]
MKKVGLYFGSFNPVHIGHIAIAGYMTEFTGLDQAWFVVSPHNPLKKKDTLLADHHRLYMAQLAVGDNDRLKATDIELNLPVPSYTIDTLTYLEEKYPNYEFSLIMGEDNLYTLHKWKNINELIIRCPLYVYPRHVSHRSASPLLDQILSEAKIHFVKAPRIEISGTFIRNGIKKGKDMSYFLAPAVWKYIVDMHFYE